MKLVSYLEKEFKIERFKEIRNREYFNKPLGGLWTSPVSSNHGWSDWCFENEYPIGENKIFLTPDPDLNLLRVDSEKDILESGVSLTQAEPSLNHLFIDFEELVKMGYDGFWLTEAGLYRLWDIVKVDDTGHYLSLMGWDVETVLLFNLDKVHIEWE